MTTSPTDEPPRGSSSTLTSPAFLGVLATAFTVAVGFGLIVPALPIFARRLGAGYTATSAVVAVFAGVRLVSSPPAGSLADRTGSRRVIIAGLVIVALSSGATAEAGSYLQLVVLRGLGGVGSALFITGIGRHLVLTVPRNQRGRAFGLLQGSFLLGGASGPAIGGLVIDAFGIRAPFYTYAVGLLAATLVAWRFLAESPPGSGDAPQPDAPQPGGAEAPPADAGTARGVLRPLLRDPTFWAALLLAMAVNWASQGMRFFGVPLFADEGLGLGPGRLGLALAVASGGQALALWPASRWSDLSGRRRPARLGAAIYTVGVLGLITVDGFGSLLVWMAIQGVATGMVAEVPSAIVGDLAPSGAAGRAIGVLGVARDVGAVVGVQASGVLADRAGFNAVFLVTAALLAVGFVASLAMRETLEPDEDQRAQRSAVDLPPGDTASEE